MAEQIFLIVFPIFFVAFLGFLYARLKSTDMGAANRVNLDVFVPILIFQVLSTRTPELSQYGNLAIGCLFVVLGVGVLAVGISRIVHYPAKVFVPPVMFKNSGNLGLPLAVFTFGEQALPVAVILFVVSSFLHYTLGSLWLDNGKGALGILKIPMIYAAVLGVAFSVFEWTLPAFMAAPVEMMAKICVPLMLFSLGVRMIDVDFRHWRIGLIAAVVSPILGILVAYSVVQVLAFPVEHAAMLIVFGALPPAVMNFILAETYDLEPAQVAAIVMVGNAMAVVSVPVALALVL